MLQTAHFTELVVLQQQILRTIYFQLPFSEFQELFSESNALSITYAYSLFHSFNMYFISFAHTTGQFKIKLPLPIRSFTAGYQKNNLSRCIVVKQPFDA